MAFKDGDLLAALRIPDARGVVTGCRHHPLAVAVEPRGNDTIDMAFKDGDLLAALCIPDAGCVQSPRHYPFVVAGERPVSRPHETGTSFRDFLGSVRIPNAPGAAAILSQHSPAVA